MRAGCGGGDAAWVAGVLAAPGTQGGWRLGQQEIQCSRRVWQPVLANTLQILASRTPLPDREAWQVTVYKVRLCRHMSAKSQTRPKQPCTHRCKTFLPVAVLPQRELSVKVAWLVGLQGPWQCQVCRNTDCLRHRSYGPIRVFFPVSCSWRPESLFGQSFSIAPPILALRGLPCLGSFSVVHPSST